MTRYQIRYHDDAGTLLDVFTQNDIARLDYAFAENAVGGLDLLMPLKWDTSYFAPDRILVVERDLGAGFSPDGERSWLLEDWEFYRDSKGNDFVKLTAYDGNALLDRHIVAYNAENAYSLKTDYADDLCKAIVRENLGASCVDTARTLTGLTVQADLSAAPSITRGFARRNVYSELINIANESWYNGTYMAFDTVTTTPGTFEFRTYTGQRGNNHGQTSSDTRNVILEQPSLKYSNHASRNYIYCGGQGQGEARTVKTATVDAWVKASRWNRREKWQDARQTEDEDAVQGEARSTLYDFRPRKILTGTIAEMDGLRYGIDYDFGDIVVASEYGTTFDCHVSAVHIRLDNGKETIENKVRGET